MPVIPLRLCQVSKPSHIVPKVVLVFVTCCFCTSTCLHLFHQYRDLTYARWRPAILRRARITGATITDIYDRRSYHPSLRSYPRSPSITQSSSFSEPCRRNHSYQGTNSWKPSALIPNTKRDPPWIQEGTGMRKKSKRRSSTSRLRYLGSQTWIRTSSLRIV